MKIKWIVAVILLLAIVFAVRYWPSEDESFPTGEIVIEELKEIVEEVVSTPKTENVQIIKFTFIPDLIEISEGDTIVWTNRDSIGHTVTSESWSKQGLDSVLLAKGDTYSYTFEEPGEYDYYCVPHPYMKGKVVVR